MNDNVGIWSVFFVRRRKVIVSYGSPRRTGVGLRGLPALLWVVALVGACAAPGSSTATSSGAASGGTAGCGTSPVKLNAYFETGFDLPFKLSEEFTKQFPNVTWDIKQDQFTNLINETPRVLASDNPPDLIRLLTLNSSPKAASLKHLDS